MGPGIPGYGSVEEQRIVVGHKESRVGFIEQHIPVHRAALVVGDIGRIGHNDVKLAARELRGVGSVGFEKCDRRHLEVFDVLGGYLEGRGRDVDGSDDGKCEIAGECHGYTSGTGAYVGHT